MDTDVTMTVGNFLVNNVGAAGVGAIVVFLVKKIVKDAEKKTKETDDKLDKIVAINEKQNESFNEMKMKVAMQELQSQSIADMKKDVKELERQVVILEGKSTAAFRQIDELKSRNDKLEEQINRRAG